LTCKAGPDPPLRLGGLRYSDRAAPRAQGESGMYAVILGLLLVVAKTTEFGPVADWSWWIVLAPFGVAAVWWQFADSTGITKRREIDKIEQRKQERRAQALAALGIDHRRDRQAATARDAARQRAETASRRDEARGDERVPTKDPSL
jgi:small Trp-rich protein